jgi:branched-chain amino acid aminotransferase
MNIFFVINDEVITPETDGAILKGITRDCVITLLKDKGYKVSIRPITIDEIMVAYDNGSLKEVFGTGTAAVVSPVCKIKYKERIIELDTNQFKLSTLAKSTIDGIRVQKVEDKFGWLEPVYEEALVD